MKITIRADSGFSNAPFYKLVDDESLFYAVGLATNQRLKKRGEKYVFLLSVYPIMDFGQTSFDY